MTGPGAEVRSDPHAIDGPWLTAALEDAGVARGAQVTEVRSGGDIGTGQAARSARLHLTWSDPDGRPASLVGKFPSADEATRNIMSAIGSYLREWIFYDRIAATVDVRAPRCHVARQTPGTPDFVLLMEDLAGSTPGEQIAGLSADQVALALEQAARLHAPRYGDPALRQLLAGDAPASSATESGGFCQMIYQAALPEFFERFGSELDDAARNLVERLGGHVARWFLGTGSPETLVHLDLRADNLLFGDTPDDPPVVVLDFQALAAGVTGSDLAYLIAGSFRDPSERAAVERDLIDEYRTHMDAAGLELSSEDLWRDYRHGSLWGLVMSVMASVSAERTDRGEAMFLAMVQRHAQQAIELEALALLE